MCETTTDVPLVVGKQIMSAWQAASRQHSTLTFLPVCYDGYRVHKVPGRGYSLCTVTAKQTHPTQPTHGIANTLSRDLLCKLAMLLTTKPLTDASNDIARSTYIIGPIPEIFVEPNEWCVQLTCLVLIEHT